MAEVRKFAFFFYPVRDMQRARRFYEEALGLRVSSNYDNHWVEYALGEGVLALSDMVPDAVPSATHGGSVALEVDDVDAVTRRVAGAGGKVARPPFDTPVCRMSVVTDPEGNGLIVHKVTDV